MKTSQGSIAVEALLLVPALFVFATMIVFAGRMTDAAGTVHRAADVAARVASQSSMNTALERSRIAAMRSMANESHVCISPAVTVDRSRIQRELHYFVRVTCRVDLRGLGLLSIGNRLVSATSSEVVDVYTQR